MFEKFNSPSLAALFYGLWELFGFRLIVHYGFIEISINLNRFMCTAMALNAAEKIRVCYSNLGPFNKFVGGFLLTSSDFVSVFWPSCSN